jgi:uncharacterized UBP type Zn finger protein
LRPSSSPRSASGLSLSWEDEEDAGVLFEDMSDHELDQPLAGTQMLCPKSDNVQETNHAAAYCCSIGPQLGQHDRHPTTSAIWLGAELS